MDTTSETFSGNPMKFLDYVLGACSITKTVLQMHGYILPDPEERANNYRADMVRMRQLCKDMRIPTERVSDLEMLIDMLDQFALQNRRVAAVQEATAEHLNQRYVPWCLDLFFDQQDESN